MSVTRCPALLVAAPASGQGKTTVVSALARLHARAGRRVSVFKVGPDFIDPAWHELASGRPVEQLDLWINGEADCAARLHAAAARSDLILVEGVMGLFDGQPSAADLAQRFGLPVLAVIDAGAMAGSFGALAFGLRHYRPGLRWAGVLANRTAGAGHADMLRDSLNDIDDWLGALPRSPAWTLPERHLGLTLAGELGDALARIDAAADALATTPLGRLDSAALARRFDTGFAAPPPAAPVPPLLAGRRIAVARDAAFCFIYPSNLATLAALGAQVEFFSPLADTRLPACDAVWLPGGYPELHAGRLAANRPLRDALAARIAAGMPVWAECGGLMLLADTLSLADGDEYRLWGLLPGAVAMQRRLAGLGPQRLRLDGHELRGHSFHYAACVSRAEVIAHSEPAGRGHGEAVYRHGPVLASFFHPRFASSPEATARLFLPRGNAGAHAAGAIAGIGAAPAAALPGSAA
ncbi:cobyrinate a,c-diamide synthase [Derxia gummosa]|uniref:Cobyrinate a,c-diamide synthase n=1 Tax=Derxia gummosa DSM 723 TaxID=1121388 RepID=A0A8B6X8F1_9BURK|nr:cobyrinate a,c-diamide synthase [Derxia gummosa]